MGILATELLSHAQPLRWVFTGDSITHGAVHTNGHRHYPELFAEHLRRPFGRPRDHVVTTGISGRRITDLEDDLEWSVRQYRPHVVSLMFGLNDCVHADGDVHAFVTAYETVLDAIQGDGATVLLHTPNRVSTSDPERSAALPPYVAAIRALAHERDLPLIDHFAAWDAAQRANAVEYWINHGCHPNAEGHRVLNRLLLQTLGGWDAESPTGRLFIPAEELLTS